MNKTPVIQGAIHKSGLYLKKIFSCCFVMRSDLDRSNRNCCYSGIKDYSKSCRTCQSGQQKKNHDGDPTPPPEKRRFYVAWKCVIFNCCFRPSNDSLYYGEPMRLIAENRLR